MRLTTLLDTAAHTGSGRWTPPASGTLLATAPSTAPVPAPGVPGAGASDERRQFNALVAGLIPCRSHDPELWFAERTADVEQAKALCGDCPLLAGCLAGALERQEPWGVWGGQVFVDGVVVAVKRGRGRPRKADVAARAAGSDRQEPAA